MNFSTQKTYRPDKLGTKTPDLGTYSVHSDPPSGAHKVQVH